MKKHRIKSVILAVLLVIVLISLVGCIKLQKKADTGNKTTDEEKPMSSVDDEVEKIEEDVEKIEEMTNMTEEADEIAPAPETTEEKQEETEKPAETEPETTQENLPVKKVTEGELVSFPNLQATDPDGDPITYTFTTPLDTSGQWQTQEGDAGEYTVTIIASDGKNEVSQQVRLVVEAKNKAPTITLTTPKEITVDEGETVKIEATAVDPDQDPVTLTFSGWMETPERETTYNDAGTHTVTITASDGTKETVEEITVTVNDVNRAPNLEVLEELTVTEGDTVELSPTTTDPDGDEVAVTFGPPLGAQDGIWATQQGDAGTYEIDVTATDGDLNATKTIKVIVKSLNKPPVIQLALPTINVEEGETVIIDAEITDPEDDELTITYSGWMNSNTYQTDYDDAGIHTVTITVTDGINTVTKEVTVNVVDKNRPPVFDPDAFN